MQSNLYNMFFIVFFIMNTESADNFCNLHKSTWYCSDENSIKNPNEDTCGAYTDATVGFNADDQNRIVKKINDMRADLAKGKFFYGTKYPSSGDMVKVKYSLDLARSAQAHINNCPFKKSERSSRLVPQFDSTDYIIDLLMLSFDNIPQDKNYEPLEEGFKKWNESDLKNLNYYTKSFKKYDPVSHSVILYNKHRLIGCGQLVFYSDLENAWKFYMECLVAAGNLSVSNIYGDEAKNKKPCEACPPSTSCATSGTYANILCAYHGAAMMINFNGYLLMVTMLAVSLIDHC